MQKEVVQDKKRSQRRLGYIITRVLITLLVLAVSYALIWLQPLTATEPALSHLQGNRSITIVSSTDLISFLPSTPAKVGFIFYPGALVDPRAYASYMYTFAVKGYATFIVKMPLNISFLGGDRAEDIIKAYPHISTWGIGGHSLGGVSASSFAATHQQVKGLLLYASYPASDLSQQLKDKVVVSVSGTNDGLATREKIKQSKATLPTNTRFVAIQGSIHGFFGDYGVQSGDGQPTISREQAQQQISNASLAFLDQLNAGITYENVPYVSAIQALSFDERI